MIAVGVVPSGASLPDGCRTDPDGALTLVLAPRAGARALLALQLDSHRMTPAFLPLPARSPIPVATAQAWLNSHRDAVEKALVRIDGQTQLTLHFNARPNTEPAVKTGSDWLHARAEAAGQRDRLANMLRRRADQQPHRLHEQAKGLALHLLVPAGDIAMRAADWQDALAGIEEAARWHMVASGGWPPMAFGPEGTT
jgi:hypothetical protein